MVLLPGNITIVKFRASQMADSGFGNDIESRVSQHVSETFYLSAKMVPMGRRGPNKSGGYNNRPENHAHGVPKHPWLNFL
jgi:hypothetical protein